MPEIVRFVVEALASVVLPVNVGPPENTTLPAVPVSSERSAASCAELENEDEKPRDEVAVQAGALPPFDTST